MSKRALYIVVILLVLTIIGSGLGTSNSLVRRKQSFNSLTLQISTNSEIYLPGKPVIVNCKFINNSSENIDFLKGAAVQGAQLYIYVAREGHDPSLYVGPDDGVKDTVYKSSIPLKPSETFETQATILWNRKLETSHLSEEAARQIKKGLIDDFYALSEPGDYYVKALFRFPNSKQVIESESVKISVRQPTGDDLVVWNEIKKNESYGYFIQTGVLPEAIDSPNTLAVTQNLEELAALYPNSEYTAGINKSLGKYQAMVNK